MTATLRVRVIPRADRERVETLPDGSLRVRLTAPPVGGKANEALVRLVARILGVARSDVRIVRGAGARDKIVQIDSLDDAAVRERLHGDA